MPIRNLADVEALEGVPFEARVAATSVFELLAGVCARHPDRLAIRFLREGLVDEPSRDITYAAFGRQIIQAANLFHALGVGPQDAVSMLLPVAPETFVALFGAQYAGMANPINFLLEKEHIVGLLRSAGAKVLLGPDPELFPGIWAKVEAVRAELPNLAAVIRVGGPAERADIDALHFETELARQPATLSFTRDIKPDDIASLFHTGGTTSAPKLARHTHRGLLAQSWTNAEVMLTGPDQTWFNGLPPFHVGGATCAGLVPFSQGATVVIPTAAGYRNPVVVKNLWGLVQRFRPTVLGMVPTSWGAALNVPTEGFDLSSLKICQSGGSAIAPEVAKAVRDNVGAPLVEGWGMTETHGFATMNPGLGDCRLGSIGLRVPYTELIVADVADGAVQRVLPAGEIGHVLVRGRQLFGGYADDAYNRQAWVEPMAAETRPAWSRGGPWLDTGDLGRLDEDGYVWLTGRAKDIIIRSGHNIDPAVIEEVLHAHPAVESAAAVGRPDGYAGELPIGFVQLKAGAEASPEAIQDFARQHIAERAAVPVEIIVLPLMPLTAVGKIFKPQLRHLAAQITLERLTRALVGDGVPVHVEVGPHPQHGSFASIRLDGPVGAQQLEELRANLSRLQLRHEVLAGAG
ncbi:acyl-CoA synthetase [Chelatococcus reniformis]|uniref:Acyl-CoA synthetase n=1 Tax=Chelatococcus reniformis TaxID=1494448 RepID=A0A916UYD9_9HYPH|nr:acyl-CoA synthetase [Chelatococcus reniformis]GGC91456.1 acyl-CoA synthetase [Chelatococcus reniformis]